MIVILDGAPYFQASAVTDLADRDDHILKEVAKFCAARRMWATIMEERFGAETEAAK